MNSDPLKTIAIALLPLLAAGCVSSGATAGTAVPSSATPTISTQGSATPSLALPDFSQLAAQAGPAVVNISTTTTVSSVSQALPFDQNDPFF